MSGVLVVAETRRGELRDVSLELIGAARTVKDAAGGRLAVAVVAADPAAHAGALALDGVDEVLTVASPAPHFEAHVAQRALEALIEARAARARARRPHDRLARVRARPSRYAPGWASRATSPALGWEDGPTASRGAYGDKLVAELDFPGRETTLLMVRAGAFEPAEGAGQAPVRAVELDLGDAAATEHVEFREAAAGDVDITKADFLLSIGRGIEDKDNIPQFEELAEKIGATLSVSRPLVDAGWMSNARQVGQSGKTVKPKVYLALGISGAVQHLAGMQKADTIIAVNTDPGGPDLQRRALRGGGRPLRGRRRSSRATSTDARPVIVAAAEKTREVFWHFPAWLEVLWYVLAVSSVLVFAYGVARPLAKYRRGQRVVACPRARSCRGAWRRRRRRCSRTRTIKRRDPLRGLGAPRDLLRLPRRCSPAR